MITAPLGVLAVLAVNVSVSDWLGRRPGWHLLGAALLVIALTAVCANVGLIPSVTDGSVAYEAVFSYVAPMAIFWLLLGVNLRSIVAAGLPMLSMFVLGATGTLVGVLAAMTLIPPDVFGEYRAALAGMFVGTYIGGALNFNAVALEFGIQREGLLYASAGVIDNLMTTVWMIATIALPRVLAPLWPRNAAADAKVTPDDTTPATSAHDAGSDDETVGPGDLALMLALGAGALLASQKLTDLIAGTGVELPQILVLTTVALTLAQIPTIQRLRGARALGMFAVLLFLAAIGALCDLGELAGTGSLGLGLSALVTLAVLVHGMLVFAGAYVLRVDPAVAAVASQANIGGGTSALALARGLDRPELVAPALLIGSLGNAVGTYLGFFAADVLA
ncbi:MAG: DUF819 family protein [Pseudomonadota bacterium]